MNYAATRIDLIRVCCSSQGRGPFKGIALEKEAKAMNLKVSTVTHGAEQLSMLHFWRIKQHREVLCFAGGAWVLYGGSL